jgi:hypothetical protein
VCIDTAAGKDRVSTTLGDSQLAAYQSALCVSGCNLCEVHKKNRLICSTI